MIKRTFRSVPEIEPAQLERELRAGADVVVLDVRDPEAFAAWHLPAGAIHNVPAADVLADPPTALRNVPDAAALRVICNAGTSSRRIVRQLRFRSGEVVNVRGGMLAWSRLLRAGEVPLGRLFTVVQFRREARGCLSYLVAADGEALVVDPGPDVGPYLDEAERRGVRIVRVLDTHVHADHLSGARELARQTGAALHLSRAALDRGVRYAGEVEAVVDGDVLPLGNRTVRVVALPGHTSDMIGLLLGEAALIGGDSLFADAVARPDLQAGDEGAADAARVLWHTLRDVVAPLPDATILLPCHYPGSRLHGPIAPTLGEVRAAVPQLALDENAFVDAVLSSMPPRPANHLAIIGVNLGDDMPADAAARLEVGANNCAAKAEWARA